MTKETDTLETLVDKTTDSINGYREAAELVRDDDARLARLFETRAQKRQGILQKLRAELTALDADNDALKSDGSTAGDLHHAFMKFRSMFQEDREAALAEIDRGESSLVESFEDAIKDCTGQLRSTLQTCLQEIRQDERTAEMMKKSA